MPLDANSSFADVKAEYRNCASYSIDNDLDKAKRFVVACRFMLDPTFLQDEHRHDGESSRLTFNRVESQMRLAEEFIATNGTNEDSAIFHSFEDYRD